MTRLVLHRALIYVAAACVMVVVLLELQILERVSYSIEKGRLRAIRENLATMGAPSENEVARRAVAESIRPAVISIEVEFEEPGSDRDAPPPAESRTSQNQTTDPTDGTTHSQVIAQEDSRPAASITQGMGSGFIVDAANSLAVTNAHVVQGARRIRVFLADGRETTAEVLGSDLESDLAVIKLKASRLHQLPLGDSAAMSVGDDVLAAGSPFGLEGTISLGIISATHRRHVRVDGTDYAWPLLQTDATVSPGSSGGPLVNMRGEAVGVTSAYMGGLAARDAVGFAIPSTILAGLLDDLIAGGPAYLGVVVWSASDPQWSAEARAIGWDNDYGVVVDEIQPRTSAARADLQPHDVIVQLNKQRLQDIEHLGRLLDALSADEQVDIQLWRDGELLNKRFPIGRRYAPR